MKKNKYMVVCKVDMSDADYNLKITIIDEQMLIQLRKITNIIKKFEPYNSKITHTYNFTHRHNFPYGDCLRTDLGEKSPKEIYPLLTENDFNLLDKIIPYCNYGFHTIKSVNIYPYSSPEKLL